VILLGLFFSFQANALLRSKYFIAVKKNDGKVLNTLEDYIPFLPGREHFYADPMLFKHQGMNYIFFEDYDYRKGVIRWSTISQDGAISAPELALELPIHLSFPFVFLENNDIFMIPETYDAKEVALFRTVKFPSNWEKHKVLVRGEHFADSMLFKHDGYWWLFTAVDVDRLRVYYSTSLDEDFVPHPINKQNLPGRNAGSVFYEDGHLVRPVMDCSKGYGTSMTLNRIEKLTPDEFVEISSAHIQPTWAPNLDGTHTYNQNEDFVIYDGRRTIDSSRDAEFSSSSLE
jgi:hypothetical protein